MKLKMWTAITLGALISFSTYANQSTRIWKSYFPNMNCSRNECAKNVPAQALEEMLEKADYHVKRKLNSTNWAFVADFTINSRFPRGYLINMKSGKSYPYLVSHGINSGDGNGNTVRFSNRNESRQSSEGLYLTAETYYGKHGYSLRMDGLEATNSNARTRAIVIHGASYVPNSARKQAGRIGRSWGCPAVAKNLSTDLINKLKGGSIYYIRGQ